MEERDGAEHEGGSGWRRMAMSGDHMMSSDHFVIQKKIIIHGYGYGYGSAGEGRDVLLWLNYGSSHC